MRAAIDFSWSSLGSFELRGDSPRLHGVRKAGLVAVILEILCVFRSLGEWRKSGLELVEFV